MLELFFGTTNAGKLRELRRLVQGLAVRVVSPDELGRPLPEVIEDGRPSARTPRRRPPHTRAAHRGTRSPTTPACASMRSPARLASTRRAGRRSRMGSPVPPAGWRRRLTESSGSSSRGRRATRRTTTSCCARYGGGRARSATQPTWRCSRWRRRTAGSWPRSRAPAAAASATCGSGRTGSATTRCSCRRPSCRSEAGGGGRTWRPIRPPRTMAELEPTEKDALSHRGAAFRALRPILEQLAFDKNGR